MNAEHDCSDTNRFVMSDKIYLLRRSIGRSFNLSEKMFDRVRCRQLDFSGLWKYSTYIERDWQKNGKIDSLLARNKLLIGYYHGTISFFCFFVFVFVVVLWIIARWSLIFFMFYFFNKKRRKKHKTKRTQHFSINIYKIYIYIIYYLFSLINLYTCTCIIYYYVCVLKR